jgi:hypothetical protein
MIRASLAGAIAFHQAGARSVFNFVRPMWGCVTRFTCIIGTYIPVPQGAAAAIAARSFR